MDRDTKQQVIKLFSMQGLSTHYQDAAIAFYHFSRHNRELLMKEIEKSFKNIEQSRLLDSSYSVDEVKDVMQALHTVIQGTLRTETQNSLYSMVELLKQVFNEADNCGLKLAVDISSLENEYSINKISQLEQMLGPKSGSRLPSLGSNPLLSNEDVFELREENSSLKKKMSAVQENFTNMMKEKTSITQTMNTLRDELEKLRQEKRDMAEREGSNSEAATVFKKVSNELKSQNSHLEEQRTSAINERDELIQQLQSTKLELQQTQKELTSKINETTQFKNMRQLLQSKNEQIKNLREIHEKGEQEEGNENPEF